METAMTWIVQLSDVITSLGALLAYAERTIGGSSSSWILNTASHVVLASTPLLTDVPNWGVYYRRTPLHELKLTANSTLRVLSQTVKMTTGDTPILLRTSTGLDNWQHGVLGSADDRFHFRPGGQQVSDSRYLPSI